MRVLQVIQDLAPGGAEQVALSLVGHLQERGCDVAVAAAPGPWSNRFPCPQFDLPILRRRPYLVPIGAARLADAIRRFRPDVVHAHNPGMGVISALATLRGRRPPALVSVHGVPEDDYPKTASVLRRAALPVVGCGPGVTAALRDLGVDVTATIVNGIPAAPATDVAAVRDSLRVEHGIDPGERLVVSVGRLVPQKHHDLTIRAFAAVEDARLVIVGGGALEQELRSVVGRLGLDDRVVLTGARDDARQVLAAADVAVLASHWEGLPLVGLEAMAAGTPLVATAVRGVRELVVDGSDGILVPPDDATALGGAISEVLRDGELARRLAAGGRARAAEFTEDAMTSAFVELYERLVPCPA